MLAEFLHAQKDELIRQVELRAAADEGPGPAKGRHHRVTQLVDELIETLQGREDLPAPRAETSRDAAIQSHERSLIQKEALSEVIQQSVAVPPSEMFTVSEWASASNARRLEERVRRLSDLLDDIRKGAVIVAPDGRIEYLNRYAAWFLHRATGVPIDQLLGKTGRELGLPQELDFSSHPQTIQALARQRASREEFWMGRWWRTRYRAITSESGDLEAIAFVQFDIHEQKLAELRLELLSRLSAMVGSADCEDVGSALASVPIPDFADWCAVNLVEGGTIVHTAVSQSDPGKAALRDAVMRAAPSWNKNPLWSKMKLTGGFQLLTDVSDELLRKITIDEEQYGFMKQVGVQSIMVQPVVSRGQIVAIFNFMYTHESGRRYGRDDPGLAAELALHATYIIENARLLKDLRASEARFRVALAGAKTAVFEQDATLRYRWHYDPRFPVNPVGRKDEELFSADVAATLTALKRRVLETGESTTQESASVIGGEHRVYRMSFEAMRDPMGKPVGIVGSATDISEEKRTQKQLGEALGSQRLLAELDPSLHESLDVERTLSALADMVIKHLADYCVIDLVEDSAEIRRAKVSCSLAEKRGVAEQFARLPIGGQRTPILLQVLQEGATLLFETVVSKDLEEWARSEEHLRLLRATEVRSLLWVPIFGRDRILGGLCLASATPDRRYGRDHLQLAEELARRTSLSLENARHYGAAERAIAARDEVLAIVAHDLRNPLSTIGMQAQNLLRSGQPESHVRKASEGIQRAAKRMDNLIRDLLDVARVEAGQIALEREELPTRDVASEAVDAEQALAASSTIELRLDGAEHPPDMYADRQRVLQVFENLIGNALKFTPPGGRITVGVVPQADCVLCSIRDTGPGIPAEALPHLFDRFWQARRSREDSRSGAGLGLAIAKGIVEAHGGRIWVESAPGEGSTFYFTIPTAAGKDRGPFSDEPDLV
jgi:signal transduction histidine kinase/PAS domain-containing protein